MKTVLVYYERLLAPGGAERQAVEECKFLLRMGVRVRLVTHQLVKDSIFDLPSEYVDVVADGSHVTQIMALRKRICELHPAIISVHSGHFELYAADIGLGIPYIFHHNSPVLLHAGKTKDYLHSWFYQRALKRIQKWAFYGLHHGDMDASFTLRQRFVLEARALAHWLSIRGAKLIVVLSHLTAREVKEVYGVDSLVSRGCLDDRIFDYTPRRNLRHELGFERRRVLLSISRLSFEKRIDVLLKSFKLLAEAATDIVLVIGGKGPERQRLEALTNQLGLSQRVYFQGFIPEAELWDYYALCDIFVTPAWADFNIAPYEALAFQKKVVWSSEMETEPSVLESGLVFEGEPTPHAFAEAIGRALNARDYERLDLKPYTWDAKFQRIYHQVAPKILGPSAL